MLVVPLPQCLVLSLVLHVSSIVIVNVITESPLEEQQLKCNPKAVLVKVNVCIYLVNNMPHMFVVESQFGKKLMVTQSRSKALPSREEAVFL